MNSELDTIALQELCSLLGRAKANSLVMDFLQECGQRLARMQTYMFDAPTPNWSGLQKEAHDLSGNAGSFGLARVGNVAQVLEALTRRRDAVGARRTAELLLECGRVDLAALGQYVDRLALQTGDDAELTQRCFLSE